MLPPEIADSLRNMPSGTHAILVYDSLDNKHDVLFSHLGFGADSEGLVYAYSEEGPDRIREGMKGFGIDAAGLEQKGMLAIQSSEEIYLTGGRVDTDAIVKGFSDLAWRYSKKGFKGIRAAAEMSPFFKRGSLEDLEKYERAPHRKFSFPGKGICAYNLVEMQNSGHLEALMPMLRAHGLVILTGPKGTTALGPDSVKERDVERLMLVRV